MKSHYYLAQALLSLRHVGEALIEAKHAYAICLETKDTSSELISNFVLRAKQAKWQSKETARLRELNHTLQTVEVLLEEKLDRDLEEVDVRYHRGDIGLTGRNEERQLLVSEAEETRQNVRFAFQDPKEPASFERVCIPLKLCSY